MEDASLRNRALNTEELMSGKTVLASKPRRINVALTTRCNIDCIMCEVKRLNWELPDRVLREIMSYFPYLERVTWQGGEAFLYPAFKEVLLAAAKFPRLTNEITTNAHLLNDEWVDLLYGIRADINISVDGTTEDVYEAIRKKSKFSNILKNLDLLNRRERNGERTLLVTVMKSNFDKLSDFINFASKYRFSRIIFQPIKANYSNDENIFQSGKTEAWEKIARQMVILKKQAAESGIYMEECLPIPKYSEEKRGEPVMPKMPPVIEKDEDKKAEIFCFAPWQQIFIEWGGNVYPHCLCVQDSANGHKRVGNILDESLESIWNGERMVQYRKEILAGTYNSRCSANCVNGKIPRSMRNILEIPELESMVDNGKELISQHNYDRAIEVLKNVLFLAPHWHSAHFELGKTYYLQNRFDAAIQCLKSACNKDANHYTYRLLAKVYKETGDFKNALQTLKTALPLFEHEKQDLIREYIEIVPAYIEQVRKNNFDGTYAETLKGSREILGEIPDTEKFQKNKLLNEIEIAEKKTVLESKMRNLIVTLSTACNLKCVMCEWVRSKKWELPQKALEEVISYFPYLERVVWQGGEAFLDGRLRGLVEKAGTFPDLRQVITTNGLLVTEEWSEILITNNVDVTFSVDGITRDVYEKIRQGAKFDTLIKNLKYFSACKKKHGATNNINLHMVVMKSNYRQIENYVDFAHELGFRYIAFLPIEGNYDNPENIFINRDTDAIDYLRNAMPRVMEKAGKYDMLIENRLPIEPVPGSVHESAGSSDNNDVAQGKMVCHLPWIQLYIDYDGSLRPDCTCRREECLGNIASDSLADVWNSAKMQQYREKVGSSACWEICNSECMQGRVSDKYRKFY